MKNLFRATAAIAAFFYAQNSFAQSSPNLIYGQVPTAAQWNSYFTAKQDVIGYVPVNKAGDTMFGLLTTAASSSFATGFHITPGIAPSVPNYGDVWVASNAIFASLGGITVQLQTVGASVQSVNEYYLNTSPVPTLSSCGTSPTVSVGSTNQGGQFTLGTGSPGSCVVTFANTYPTKAFCTVTPSSNYTGTYYISAQSSSALTVTLGTPTSSVAFNYSCQGN